MASCNNFVLVGVQSSSKIKPPADRRRGQWKNASHSITPRQERQRRSWKKVEIRKINNNEWRKGCRKTDMRSVFDKNNISRAFCGSLILCVIVFLLVFIWILGTVRSGFKTQSYYFLKYTWFLHSDWYVNIKSGFSKSRFDMFGDSFILAPGKSCTRHLTLHLKEFIVSLL